MNPTILAVAFLAVMGGALACFWAAFVRRKTLRVHKRLGVLGTLIDLGGTVVVIVTSRVLHWDVPANHEGVAFAHRCLAYVATALVLLVAITGARRDPLHVRLWPVFLPVYTLTYVLAVVAYAPLP